MLTQHEPTRWYDDMDDLDARYDSAIAALQELAERNDILRAEREAMVRIDHDALDEWLDSRDDYDVEQEA